VAARGHGTVMLMISGPGKKIQVAFLILFFIQNKTQGKIRVIWALHRPYGVGGWI